MYKSINRLFLLPKPNGQEVAFVISLEDPIRQGNQRFSHLVMNVKVCYQLVLYIFQSIFQSMFSVKFSLY